MSSPSCDRNTFSDVVSLFPSVPLEHTFTIIENKWPDIQKHTKMDKKLFLDIIKFCIKENRYLKYGDKIYTQRKGMPMGSPASPIVSDIFMEELLRACLEKLVEKPKIITKYVDDIFAVVKKSRLQETLQMLNSYHKDVKFTLETEKDGKLPYLDTLAIRDNNNKIILDWYQKPSSSGRIINFYSKHPRSTKINTAMNFIKRVLDISHPSFWKENEIRIKNILKLNNYPSKTIQKLLWQYKNPKQRENTQRQPLVYKSFTNTGKLFNRIKNSAIYNKNEIKITAKSNFNVGRLFSNTKTKIKKEDKSNVVYEIRCQGDGTNNCDKVYVGTTKTKLRTRISSHKSDQKCRSKDTMPKTALAEHCIKEGHYADFDNVNILQKENNYSKRLMLEMLHIINVPVNYRINYKSDVDNCAHTYRNLIANNGHWTNKRENKIISNNRNN